MARMTAQQANDTKSDGGLLNRLLAVLVTAINPDGTPYTMPVALMSTAPATQDILSGRKAFTVTTATPTTVITIPAGRTWTGQIGASVTCSVAAGSAISGQATAQIAVGGANSAPAPGIYLGVDTRVGTALATSVNGSQSANFASSSFIVAAPVGNSVNIEVTTVNSGTVALVDVFALGKLT